MQRGFTKLFNTIVTSTIWQEDDKTRIVWITMLAIADHDGIVSAAVPGLASVAHVDIPSTEKALQNLAQPDEYSRTQDFDGRRIEAIDGGWLILNYEKYRKMLSEEERKEYKAKWIRQKRRQMSTASTGVDGGRRKSTSPSASVSLDKSRCSVEEAKEFCKSIGLPASDGEAMFLHWQEKGWAKVKDWKLTIKKWKSFGYMPSQKAKKPWDKKIPDPGQLRLDREFDEAQKRKEERKREQTDEGRQNYGCM